LASVTAFVSVSRSASEISSVADLGEDLRGTPLEPGVEKVSNCDRVDRHIVEQPLRAGVDDDDLLPTGALVTPA